MAGDEGWCLAHRLEAFPSEGVCLHDGSSLGLQKVWRGKQHRAHLLVEGCLLLHLCRRRERVVRRHRRQQRLLLGHQLRLQTTADQQDVRPQNSRVARQSLKSRPLVIKMRLRRVTWTSWQQSTLLIGLTLSSAGNCAAHNSTYPSPLYDA